MTETEAISSTSTNIGSGRPTVGSYVRWFAAALSVASAAIHYGYAPHHLQEDWAHGWFFILTATAQLGFAFIIVTRPSRWLWTLAALLNIGMIGTWIVSRTAGLPFGPEALRTEAVGTADVVSVVLEAAVLVLALVALFAPALMNRELRDSLGARFTTGALSGVALLAAFVMLTPTYTDSHGGAGHADGGHGSALTGTTPCELSGDAASPGQENTDAEGHAHRGPTAQQVVSESDRLLLIEQQRQAREVAVRFPTVADAEAAGYKMSTVFVPCIGAHYTNTRLAARFDPAKPSELLFDGTNPDSKIVGLSFLVWHPNGAPEGFAGPNDVWHQHNFNGGLCLKGGVVVGAEALTEDECAARGGAKMGLEDIWMVHDWIVPGWECSWGVFAGECPELGGVTGKTAWDVRDGSTTDPLQAIGN
jgi:hypothetical protein